MALFSELGRPEAFRPCPGAPVDGRTGTGSFKPIRTEDFKPDPGARYKWLVIEPDIFPGEDIVVVLDPVHLAEAETDQVLGAHIIGPSASELIAECVVTMEFHGAAEDLARIVHAHPTLSEAVHEAALNVDKRAIHRVN